MSRDPPRFAKAGGTGRGAVGLEAACRRLSEVASEPSHRGQEGMFSRQKIAIGRLAARQNSRQ
ncbi:hypothetical protein J4732_07735 [Serratia marcescens]|uniref:Uncharacterized protein n=1 Tax=Serratia marcescens TaxID=615 RepID=A0A939NPQ5_SERMA|nr:hypothetical protein [Serratia marcescens]